jgi:hypothetical protein
MSQLIKLIMNTSGMKFTPCILHLKFLHIAEQCIVPPFSISTTKVLMGVVIHCSLLADVLLRKLWLLSESIKMYRGCLSAFSVTLNLWQSIVPFRALREKWGIRESCLTIFTSPSLSTTSLSSLIMHKEYSRLFLHR